MGSTPYVTIGGVKLYKGFYLQSGAAQPTQDKPSKRDGYAHFDGDTLTLYNFTYTGPGGRLGDIRCGIHAGEALTAIKVKGRSAITVQGTEKTVALYFGAPALVIRGGGEVSFQARGGQLSNYAILSEGTLHVKRSVVRLFAEPGQFEIRDGEKVYLGESYALKVGQLIARAARIRGHDKRSEQMNLNLDREVVIDFPRLLLLLWSPGCLAPLLLFLLALIALLIALWAFFLRSGDILEPDFNILDIEDNAQAMAPAGDTTPGQSSDGGGAVVLNYTYEARIDRQAEQVTLYFGLPHRSNRDAVLQLIVGDTLLAQSGRIQPGFEVYTLALEPGVARRLQTGAYDGILRVLYYNAQTGERSMLDTQIDLTIVVPN